MGSYIKYAISACSSGLLAITLSGCFGSEPPKPQPKPKPEFKPSSLDEKARGITIASSKPYNCKIVGESEGYEEAGNTRGATKQKMRQGAINQLKNESVHAIAEGQKVMIAIGKEEMKCRVKEQVVVGEGKKKQVQVKYNEVDCTTWDPIPENAVILSYRIYGDLYDCGAK
ncbi:hypothetical protein DCO58_07540 [Helicobacter saguini]|uniref:DUF4156 domain-containing protein n=1 Tax=Helicobacter saguini TaxID=1548018 RepID=A0A347VND0_9HELI|nr:hypothetical protein [Helicobacter saguini]MWV61815.1 hypothetical protein [Helicobacter saguini]MWV67510.1 hypothetical protein [Helicobacter saguini]MWV69861.1 hypothetical protein [Helicobacter saguini]MWV72921.1 hypothetical protein [Helicobacter saguini]TLD93273.1 hypothetical protein LS64_009170 [Helicobacter saguini]